MSEVEVEVEATVNETGVPSTTEPVASVVGDGRLLDPLVRRWTAIGTVTSVLTFWLLGTLGQPWRLFADPRSPTAVFFDLQARSLMSGRLSVPAGSLLNEEYVTPQGSHMYFGIFPAILRVPVLALTHGFEGRLTLASSLLAVAVACVAAARLARRAQRVVARSSDDPVLRCSYRWFALAAAAPVLFSPVLFLATRSMVYNEAAIWGAAAALWAVDAAMQWWYLGRTRDLVAMAIATTVALNSRVSVGLFPVVFITVLGVRRLIDRRHAGAATFGVSVALALATYSTVNYLRFRQWWGAPAELQQSYQNVAAQQAAAALTDGSLFSFRFMPTTAVAYLWPFFDSVQLSPLFPFIRFGASLQPFFGMPMQTSPTGSVPTAMPVLTVVALIGAMWLVRKGDLAWRAAAAAGCLVSLLTLGFWAVWHRYLVDFVPVLVVMAAPGMWVAIRWCGARAARVRVGVAALVGAALLLGAAGQAGLAMWSRSFQFFPDADERLAMTRLRYSIHGSLVGGEPPQVLTVPSVSSPADVPETRVDWVLIVGDCDAMYLPDFGWTAVERRSGGAHRVVVGASDELAPQLEHQLHDVAVGDGWRIEVRPWIMPDGVRLAYVSGGVETLGGVVQLKPTGVVLDVVADPVEGVVSVLQDGVLLLDVPATSASGMRPAEGWEVFRSEAEVCRSILDRVTPRGR